MTVFVHLVEQTPVALWGLSAGERIRRVLGSTRPVQLLDDLQDLPASASVMLLRGDYLFDSRVVQALAASAATLLRVRVGDSLLDLAAHVPAPQAGALRRRLLHPQGDDPLPPGIVTATPDELCPPYQEQLLKSDPPFVLPVTAENRKTLERLLFGSAYKGITDFVTKWVWPVPAQWGVRLCVGLGLRPNHVTALNWLLAVAVGLLFWKGYTAWGLTLAWLMTYLDTVDGKLARVTVSSSKVGHLLDHILDIVHPPFWYLAWGLGLDTYDPLLLSGSVGLAIWIIFVGYVVGRLVEGGFQLWLGRFGIFCWRKIDSYSRLITARRNPCLVLLTGSALAQRPDVGLEAVALWTLASTLFLVLRLSMAGYTRIASGPLNSWLTQVGEQSADRSLAVRWFTRAKAHDAAGPRRK